MSGISKATSIRVGIIGAGAIACATAALLESNGHVTTIWSPSNNPQRQFDQLTAIGVIKGTFEMQMARRAEQLVDQADVLIFGFRYMAIKQQWIKLPHSSVLAKM